MLLSLISSTMKLLEVKMERTEVVPILFLLGFEGRTYEIWVSNERRGSSGGFSRGEGNAVLRRQDRCSRTMLVPTDGRSNLPLMAFYSD
jgi:hypothetical protein